MAAYQLSNIKSWCLGPIQYWQAVTRPNATSKGGKWVLQLQGSYLLSIALSQALGKDIEARHSGQ